MWGVYNALMMVVPQTSDSLVSRLYRIALHCALSISNFELINASGLSLPLPRLLQALEATQEAIQRFDAAGTPWLRPTDYYAEMVKTDDHMNKVKSQFMYEQKQIEEKEERRRQREQKQYGKKVQLEKTQEKQKDKKRQIDNISKYERCM